MVTGRKRASSPAQQMQTHTQTQTQIQRQIQAQADTREEVITSLGPGVAIHRRQHAQMRVGCVERLLEDL